MKQTTIGAVAATIALLVALSGGAAWGANVTMDINYDWDGTCVSNIDFDDPSDKNLTLTKKAKKIRWKLIPRAGSPTQGAWEITAKSPAQLCKSKYKGNSSKAYLECVVNKAIKYEYELSWSDSACNGGVPVVADPVIIFDDGSGSIFFFHPFWTLVSGALAVFAAFLGFKLRGLRAAAP